MKLTQQN